MEEPADPAEPAEPVGPTIVKQINLSDEPSGLETKESIVLARFKSVLKIFMKLIILGVCISVCCLLFWLEAMSAAKTTPIFTPEELKKIEDEEARMHLRCFILLIWSFSVYTLVIEMMSIMTLNEKIRILESMRYRSKMEATLSLIRQKSYFDAEAVDFIFRNTQNSQIETVIDELEVEEMIRHRVHGMNPHKTFY